MFNKFKELIEENDLLDISVFLLVVILGIFVLAMTVVLIVVAIKGSDYNIHHSVETVVGLFGGLNGQL